MTTTVVLSKIAKHKLMAKVGQAKGHYFKRCAFKCIDKNSKFYEKYVHMNVFEDYEYEDIDGNVIHDSAHSVVKNNLIEGTVFEGVVIVEAPPVSEFKDYIKPFENNCKAIRK